jgi:hypothetical protein
MALVLYYRGKFGDTIVDVQKIIRFMKKQFINWLSNAHFFFIKMDLTPAQKLI